MKDLQKKEYACMDACQNERGFTLLSTMLALGIIVITLPLIASLINMINTDDQYEALSVRRYFSYMHDEALQAKEWSVKDHTLEMTHPDGETAIFKQQGQLIIRQLSGGYEVYLRNVDNVTFKALSYGVRIQIMTSQGETYAKTIKIY